jgi:hypothetical protein
VLCEWIKFIFSHHKSLIMYYSLSIPLRLSISEQIKQQNAHKLVFAWQILQTTSWVSCQTIISIWVSIKVTEITPFWKASTSGSKVYFYLQNTTNLYCDVHECVTICFLAPVRILVHAVLIVHANNTHTQTHTE